MPGGDTDDREWGRMIKLFASDLDGTLLNCFHNVDRTILAAIREAVASGAHVAVATGRTLRSTSDFGFGGSGIEAVCANGSIVLDRDGRIIHHGTVDPAFVEELLRAFPQVCFECVGLEHTFVTGTEEERFAGFKGDGIVKRIIMRGMRGRRQAMSADCLYSQGLSDVLAHEVCKINARVAEPSLERELHAFIDAHADSVVDTPFDPVMFEITDKDVNKGASVAWLAGYLGISEDEVAVYGDGGNDLAMLRRFEHAYAPSNGSDAAKEAAGSVIGSCVFHAVPRHIRATLRAQAGGRA